MTPAPSIPLFIRGPRDAPNPRGGSALAITSVSEGAPRR